MEGHLADLTVEYAQVERPIESLTLTLTEDEARAVLNVLTADSGHTREPAMYQVRRDNSAVYDVIEVLEDIIGEDR